MWKSYEMDVCRAGTGKVGRISGTRGGGVGSIDEPHASPCTGENTEKTLIEFKPRKQKGRL